jgi:hypothetical protein
MESIAIVKKKQNIGSKKNAGSFQARVGFATTATVTSCKTSPKLEESRVKNPHPMTTCIKV